jgi:chromosome segregation ATPase
MRVVYRAAFASSLRADGWALAGFYTGPSKSPEDMSDDNDILSAIATNHAVVVSLIDGLARSTKTGFDRVDSRFDRVEARLDRVETDVRELQTSVARIETKLDRHETRLEALEARS